MRPDWKTIRIESSPIEIIDGDRGVNYPKLEEFFEDDYCLFLNTSNVTKQGFNFSKTQFITKEKDSLLGKGKLKQFDIVLTTRGTVGNIAYFDEKIPYKNIRINSGMVIFRNNNVNVVSTKYFYQFLKSNLFRDQVISFSSGSAQPQLPIGDLKQIEFPIPPLSIQNRIAEILSSLDDKIELNRQTNATLEAIAQAIFKEWFVDFNYPGATGEMVESELGLIPKGWRVEKIGKVLDTALGGTPSTKIKEYWENGTVPWINSGKVNEFRISQPTTYITETALMKSNTKLLPKGTVVIAITGATLGQVSILEIDSCANQSVIGILENERISSEYIYLWISHNIDRIISNQSGGAQQHINTQDVKNTYFVLPEPQVLREFKSFIAPIFESESKLCFETHTLTRIRDTLLPRLVTGDMEI